jgi:hypothetical protein
MNSIDRKLVAVLNEKSPLVVNLETGETLAHVPAPPSPGGVACFLAQRPRR